MSYLINSKRLTNSWLRGHAIMVNLNRNHWNKDYLPGPHPRTDEEKIAAAEKYALSPSDYETYPDDGQGYGDYPKLPYESTDARDVFYPWDHPELKRNFNEPMHVKFELLREDRYDASAKLRKPMWYMVLQTVGAIGTCYALFSFCEKMKMFPGVTPRQYPTDGKKHYTFELKEEEEKKVK